MLRILGTLALVALALPAQDKKPEKLAPYYPTPEYVVEKMLNLSGLKRGERMFDLGSGDGRIVIMAAQKYGATATGVELDKDLWKQSMEKIRSLGLEKSARIIQGDAFIQDYSSADVVTVYLLPNSNDKMRPLLEKQLKKGTRIISHDFEFAAWKPEKTVTIDDDGEGRSHTLYLYRR
ncbi:MAG: class I SAM-dependent methyltransferase [Bryobacteraceae bacterium]